MKSYKQNLFITCCFLITTLMGSQWANANEKTNKAMWDMAISASSKGIAEEKDINIYSQCLGVSRDTLLNSFDTPDKRCFDTYKSVNPDDFLDKAFDCVSESLLKSLGVSKEKLSRCSIEAEKDPSVKLELEANALEDKLDSLPDDDYAGREKLENQIDALRDKAFSMNRNSYDESASPAENYQTHLNSFAEQMQQIAEASKKTIHLITLPIYENSTVMMHAITGSTMGGHATLPAATFASPDGSDKILAYYKKELPSFSLFTQEDGQYLLMEQAPKGFNMYKDLSTYYSTPHILISPQMETANNGMQIAPSGTRTKIEIAYIAD